MAFRFALITPDNEPYDPAVFLCAEPQWSVGDVVVLGRDRRFRILDVQPPSTDAAMEDITAVWTVERLDP
jgi:uncharacterized Zn finger protein